MENILVALVSGDNNIINHTPDQILQGKDYLSVLSPIFVTFLLTRVSGIPILERQNWKKWKENAQYLQYVQNTPKLIPFLY